MQTVWSPHNPHKSRGSPTGSTHEVTGDAGTDAVTVKTTHATKEIEYPLVILTNMNANTFPSTGGDGSTTEYAHPMGLQQRKLYRDEAQDVPYVYDNWRTDVWNACLA